MTRKMGIQESRNRYIHWFSGEDGDWHAWVYEGVLYAKLAPGKLLVVWSNNPNPKIGEFEIFNLMYQMNTTWEKQINVVIIPSYMFNTRITYKKES